MNGSRPRRLGVHLRRAFGCGNNSDFDSFLRLDDFRNEVPDDYPAGFPWHPHRGIETVTYEWVVNCPSAPGGAIRWEPCRIAS